MHLLKGYQKTWSEYYGTEGPQRAVKTFFRFNKQQTGEGANVSNEQEI
jgi:hypothetical protein